MTRPMYKPGYRPEAPPQGWQPPSDRKGINWKLVMVLAGTVVVIVASIALDPFLSDLWKPTLAERIALMLLLGWLLVGRPMVKQLERIEHTVDDHLQRCSSGHDEDRALLEEIRDLLRQIAELNDTILEEMKTLENSLRDKT